MSSSAAGLIFGGVALVLLALARRRRRDGGTLVADGDILTARSTRPVTPAEQDAYVRDGYVILRNVFDAEEVALMRAALEQDKLIEKMAIHKKDNDGALAKLTLWTNNEEDNTYNLFSRSARLACIARDLMQAAAGYNVEPYHLHSKLMLKEPRTGGSFEWHQDFGYWWQAGILNPNKTLATVVAIDDATLENGCLQYLRGSHTLGRLDHGVAGTQVGAHPMRVEQAMAEGHAVVPCLMRPGDVAVQHGNTLHMSERNRSDTWRRCLIVSWNGKSNPPNGRGLDGRPLNVVNPDYFPCRVTDDGAIKALGVRGFSAHASCDKAGTMRTAGAGFLDVESDVAQYKQPLLS